jgi:galactonate dehydratase
VFNPTDKTDLSGWLNLSDIVAAVDTNAGITGFGQGGTPDLLRYSAGALIGQDPFRTEYLWQRMYRSSIYPAGRERLHAVGALDCALWDIKGKALKQPVYELLGGRARDYVECYRSFGALRPGQAREQARQTMADGFRVIRFHTVPTDKPEFDARHALFVEDPLHAIDDLTLFAELRRRVTVPLAAGEQFGDLRDGNLPLVEQRLIDYLRSSIPNVGGITSYRKIAALCEAHSVALVPHFTGPIATAAVIHSLLAFPGVAVDLRRVNQIAELTERGPASLYQGESLQRPDGSYLYL